MSLAAFDSPATTAAYLRTLPAIRERCSRVHALAQEGKLEYFDYHPEKEQEAAELKRKEEEESAAKAYAEFLEMFEGKDNGRRSGGNFVRADTKTAYVPASQTSQAQPPSTSTNVFQRVRFRGPA